MGIAEDEEGGTCAVGRYGAMDGDTWECADIGCDEMGTGCGVGPCEACWGGNACRKRYGGLPVAAGSPLAEVYSGSAVDGSIGRSLCIGSGNDGSAPIDVTSPPELPAECAEVRTGGPHAVALDAACAKGRGSFRGLTDAGFEKE